MYKRYGTILILFNIIILLSFISVKGLQINRVASTKAFQVEYMSEKDKFSENSLVENWQENDNYKNAYGENSDYQQNDYEDGNYKYTMANASSGQRVVSLEVLEVQTIYDITEEDYKTLLKIVEAEAGGEDTTGKLLVANVVLNRVNSSKFPDTITEVVYQRSEKTTQFSPVSSGRIDRVKISEDTVDAVNMALKGVDESQGALYFAARKYAENDKMKWFDRCLTKLFAHGGHEFFL